MKLPKSKTKIKRLGKRKKARPTALQHTKPLPSARRLTIIPSTRGMTMLNFPVAPWIFIRNNPVFKGWMKITGTSFSRVVDLRKDKSF